MDENHLCDGGVYVCYHGDTWRRVKLEFIMDLDIVARDVDTGELLPTNTKPFFKLDTQFDKLSFLVSLKDIRKICSNMPCSHFLHLIFKIFATFLHLTWQHHKGTRM